MPFDPESPLTGICFKIKSLTHTKVQISNNNFWNLKIQEITHREIGNLDKNNDQLYDRVLSSHQKYLGGR